MDGPLLSLSIGFAFAEEARLRAGAREGTEP